MTHPKLTMRHALLTIAPVAFVLVLAACTGGPGVPDALDEASSDSSGVDAVSMSDVAVAEGALPDGRVVRGPFATRVVSFEPGEGAGFGARSLPDVVLGPPVGAGDMAGGTDVVSLGRGGRICLALDDVDIIDEPGPDFLVFENPFIRAGTAEIFYELGEVSVSEDGVSYRTFTCTTAGPPFMGCAGFNPVYSRPGNGIAPDDPANAGGDPFDLAQVGLARARFVCVRDLGTRDPSPPTTGFDLDAIAAVHYAPR